MNNGRMRERGGHGEGQLGEEKKNMAMAERRAVGSEGETWAAEVGARHGKVSVARK